MQSYFGAKKLDTEHKLRIWQQAIETQMHFAELSIKMRQLGLAVAGATLALAVVLHQNKFDYSIPIPLYGFPVYFPISSILCLTASAVLHAARLIDVGVYHKMLRGAVKFNELFEESIADQTKWKSGLTEAISAYSRFEKPYLVPNRQPTEKHWANAGGTENAETRIAQFYAVITIGLLVAAGMLIYSENVWVY